MFFKGRILVANTLVMSLFRYTFRFLYILVIVRYKLNKVYYRLIYIIK